MLHRDQGSDGSVNREETRIRGFQERLAEEALERHGFDPDSCLPRTAPQLEEARPAVPDIPEEKMAEAIGRYNTARTGQERIDAARLPRRLKDPGKTTYISIDDIGVTRQKESREPGSTWDTKYVEDTVVHVAHETGATS